MFSTGKAAGQVIYVDKQLSGACTGTYSVANRDCSGSDGDAYPTLAQAAAVAEAGTTVLIRAGVYEEQLSPEYSGTADAPVVFKNYGDELVELTGSDLSPAIWIYEKNYVVVEGLYVHHVRRWLNALGSNHLTIRDNVFEMALDPYGSSKTGLFFQSCHYNVIENNVLHNSTQDNLGMVDCDYNLIRGNEITEAEHALWALKCSNYNILRDNYFFNGLQKIGEIYDCHSAGFGGSDYPKLFSYDDTKYNVVEHNVFAYTPSPIDASPYAGIQYAGQHGIIRRNVFYECEGPPVSLTLYGSEANYNYGNRLAHNVFFDNEFGGVDISGSDDYTFFDQQFKNNIFFKNRFVQRDFRWDWYYELDQKPVQIKTARIDEIAFEGNVVFNEFEDELYVVAYGVRTSSNNPAPEPLSWWESNHSDVFSNSVQADPAFVNPATYDFHLSGGSPAIDAGVFLTETTGAGFASTVISVADAGWFTDGFGIQPGDTIRLEGQAGALAVVEVDYAAQTLTVSEPVTWEAGTGVTLFYEGSKPDIGAYEYAGSVGLGGDFPKGADVVFYPNPAESFFEVRAMAGVVESVAVFDVLGRFVREATGARVDVADLPPGVYGVKVLLKDGREAFRQMIKQ